MRAALEIRTEAAKLGINVSGGIDTGEVYARWGAGTERGTFDLTGSAVDLAMRLAGQAQSGQILVSEATYYLSRRAFEFRSLSLPGKEAGTYLSAYAVYPDDRYCPDQAQFIRTGARVHRVYRILILPGEI